MFLQNNFIIMKKVIASFLTTRYDLMKKHWEENAVLEQKGTTGTNKEIGRDVDLGGILIEVDWDSKKITKKRNLSCPSGISYWGDNLVVASMRQNVIYILNTEWNIIHTLTHPILNDIHSIYVTRDDTLLVASTGVDAIIEFNKAGDVLWKWFAFQNAFNIDQFGRKRSIQIDGVDHRKNDYPTLYQTTHLNSVIQHPQKSDIVIATLFHQGLVVSIDKKTGDTVILFEGLLNPHSIRKINNGYIVSDTKRGEVVFMDESFREIKRQNTGSVWLQDSKISSWGTLLVARGDKGDIVEISLETGETLNTFTYNKNWKIYQIY